MGKKKPVSIGKHNFDKQGDAEAYYKAILWKYKIGDEVVGDDAEDVTALFSRHRDFDKKIGPGLRRIVVMLSEEGSRCLGVERLDGAQVGFSYHRCVTQRWD